MDVHELPAYVEDRVLEIRVTGAPERLSGGNLNHVWRVPAVPESVIVKQAPPHIATTPDVPLDPSRCAIETKCLRAFDAGGALHDLSSDALRPPRLLAADAERAVLVMEDIGPLPSLDAWLRTADAGALAKRAPTIGRTLGRFVGRLHQCTLHDEAVARRFDNTAMQETRHAVQYRAIGDVLASCGVPDADALGEKAMTVGERFLQPGRCLTMGDLWPPSILVGANGLRLIDWELAHFGQPEQDVAHLAAHLWMLAHRAPTPAVKRAVPRLYEAFTASYQTALGTASDALQTETMHHRAAVHFGAEILVRAVGNFQDGYVYAGLSHDHAAIREAVNVAARAIREEQGPV